MQLKMQLEPFLRTVAQSLDGRYKPATRRHAKAV